jgi:hypothetical protein
VPDSVAVVCALECSLIHPRICPLTHTLIGTIVFSFEYVDRGCPIAHAHECAVATAVSDMGSAGETYP